MTDDAILPVGVRLGFVAIGRNEGDRLIRCLDSLSRHPATIVYVDSGSTDGSVAEAEARGAAIVPLDMTRPFSAGRARNEGFEALKLAMPDVQYVQFVDGDCELVPEWLPAAFAFLSDHPDVVAVCGRRKEREPGASVYNALCDIEWNTPVGEAEACGGDSLVRAAAFEAVGGFNGRMIAGEEPELCSRLRAKGGRIWRIDALMTLHDAAMYRFRQWWLRGVRSGFGYAQVERETRNQPTPLYRTEVKRAAFWAGLIPVVALACAVLHPVLGLAVLAVYPLQVARIAVRRGLSSENGWAYAFFSVLAKFPELQGILKFGWATLRGQDRSAILYK